MKLEIDEEFRSVCKNMVDEYESLGENALVWSDDRYQSDKFCGGWNPTMNEFASVIMLLMVVTTFSHLL